MFLKIMRVIFQSRLRKIKLLVSVTVQQVSIICKTENERMSTNSQFIRFNNEWSFVSFISSLYEWSFVSSLTDSDFSILHRVKSYVDIISIVILQATSCIFPQSSLISIKLIPIKKIKIKQCSQLVYYCSYLSKKKVYYCSFALKTRLRKYIQNKKNTPLFFHVDPSLI